MRPRLAMAVATLTLVLPATAHAGFVAATPIDGPSPDIQAVGDLDVARDGNGVLAYVRREGGLDRIFVTRLVGGIFQPPERVDAGLETASAQPAVAASDGGRLVAVFISGGQAFAGVRATGAAGWGAPQPLAAGASSPSVDMSINGVAYATFTVGGDVRAARLNRNEAAFTVLADPLDIDASNVAGGNGGASKVAVSADGTALAVWGEAGHVYSRRLFGLSISVAPQDLNAAEIDGHAPGTADAPDVGIEDDSSFAWVAFRQRFADGGVQRARAVARRLKGSRYEDPVLADGLSWGGESAAPPELTLSGRGAGQLTATTTSTGAAITSILKDDIFHPGAPVAIAGASRPVGTIAETLDRTVAWMQGDGTVHGRYFDDQADRRAVPAAGPEAVLSSPDLGVVDPAGGLVAAGNRVGDSTLAFIQAGADGRRVVVALYDRPPGSFSAFTTQRWRKFARPPVHWGAAQDLNGGVTYRVEVDGLAIGETRATRLKPLSRVPDGEHRWRVLAVDRFGQVVATKSRVLRVDATPPRLAFKVRRKGAVATVTVDTGDVVPSSGRASGLAAVRIDFGDRSATVAARKAAHRYRRKGRFTIRVRATDRAGNVAVATRRVRVR